MGDSKGGDARLTRTKVRRLMSQPMPIRELERKASPTRTRTQRVTCKWTSFVGSKECGCSKQTLSRRLEGDAHLMQTKVRRLMSKPTPMRELERKASLVPDLKEC